MLILLFSIVAILLLIFVFLKWATPDDSYFVKRNIKFIDSKKQFQISMGLFTNKTTATEFVQEYYRLHPNEPIFGFGSQRAPQYFVRSPEMFKQFAIKDFEYFEDHRQMTDVKADKLWGNSSAFLKGEKWRQMRATLSPAFTGSKMRQMFELVVECADDVVKHFSNRIENGEQINIEMKDFFTRYTNDVIATCAFGLKINSLADPENEFYINGKKMMNFSGIKFILKMIVMQLLPAVVRLLKLSMLDRSVANSFKQVILNTMNVRQQNNIYRPDLIDTMMQIRDGTLKYQSNEEKHKEFDDFASFQESGVETSVKSYLDDDEIVALCFSFFIAGFDTSATLLTFASYELTANPDIQQKLYDEIIETESNLAGKCITYDVLQKMKYMDQVTCETLRQWPPAVQLDRICVKDYICNDGDKINFKMDKGSVLLFPVYSIQHDPKYFRDPERFDPDRFNDENRETIVPGAYLPFGVGTRSCIGSRFAVMEVKAILYFLLLNFSLEPNKDTQIPMQLKKSAFVPTPQNGMHPELKKRK